MKGVITPNVVPLEGILLLALTYILLKASLWIVCRLGGWEEGMLPSPPKFKFWGLSFIKEKIKPWDSPLQYIFLNRLVKHFNICQSKNMIDPSLYNLIIFPLS